MTLEQWTDIVARMTPEQREAMGYAMMAAACSAQGEVPMSLEDLRTGLLFSQDVARSVVSAIYPG